MSKTILFYFTGTGNSLAVARKIANRVENSIVLPMINCNPSDYICEETTMIGLIYPVHMNAVPWRVTEFVKTLKLVENCYLFAVATHGGIPGLAGANLYKLAKDSQLKLDAYFEIEAINNTPKGVAPKPLMRLNWEQDIMPEKVAKMMVRIEEELDDILKDIQVHNNGLLLKSASKCKGFNYWFMSQVWKMSENSKPKLSFLLDESCTGCGLCEKLCTTRRIKMDNGKPKWVGEVCHYCYACFNYCPVQAIGVKHYTKKLGRYHHPEISAEDLMEQVKQL